jgi:hypothetical protein
VAEIVLHIDHDQRRAGKIELNRISGRIQHYRARTRGGSHQAGAALAERPGS